MKLIKLLVLSALAFSVSGGVYAADDMQAKVKEYIEGGFHKGDNQDPKRLEQDETLKICSETRGKPSGDQAKAIMEREKATIQYPKSGVLMGNWEKGKKAFTDGFAMRIGRYEPDAPDKVRGGNCYACHAADPKELAAGNLGTSLRGYGKIRGNTWDTVKYTYDKIYNAQSIIPCSNMPRLGHNGVLSPEQIADIVSFLVDPASPVNK